MVLFGQDSQKQDSRYRTARTRQPEQDSILSLLIYSPFVSLHWWLCYMLLFLQSEDKIIYSTYTPLETCAVLLAEWLYTLDPVSSVIRQTGGGGANFCFICMSSSALSLFSCIFSSRSALADKCRDTSLLGHLEMTET